MGGNETPEGDEKIVLRFVGSPLSILKGIHGNFKR